MRRRLAICVMALTAAAASAGRGGDAAQSDGALSATGDARVAVFIDATGLLRETQAGGRRLGLRWPGPAGSEFLGSCGFVLRFENGARAAPVFLEQGALRPESRDAVIGDGGISAEGRSMLVTRAVSRGTSVSITQEHHYWSFGHVRDFIGFTTTIGYAPQRGAARALRRFEAALVSDFRIGDPHDPARADNDRYLYLAGGEDGSCHREGAAVAAAREPGGPLAAVVVFSASGPGAEPLEVSSLIMPAAGGPDSLWAAVEARRATGSGPAGDPPDGTAPVLEDLGGGVCRSEEIAGNLAIVHCLGQVPELAPNESVVVEWALVFGRDPEALMRGVARARETWEGSGDSGGGRNRWVVPARKALRIEVGAALAPVWVQGERRAAAVVMLEEGGADDIEWLAVAGERVEQFEQVGDRIVAVIETVLVGAGEAFMLEGQLADGTIFAARITAAELERFRGENDLAPGRLPDESLRLFPNPFVSITTINVSVQDPLFVAGAAAARPGSGSVRIYDVKGRLVRSMLDEELRPGDYSLDWDGTDESGTAVVPGVYYCKLQIGERSLTKRMILLR